MMRSDCAIVPPFPPCEGLRCGGCPACTRTTSPADNAAAVEQFFGWARRQRRAKRRG